MPEKCRKKLQLFAVLAIVTLLCTSVFLTGCNGGKDQSEITEQKEPVSEASAEHSQLDLTLCTKETKTGFFTTEYFADSYGTICYTDYEAKKQIVLCDIPNCSHNSDSCRSYIEIRNGDYAPMILTVRDSLLLVYSAQSTEKTAQIQIMDMNGDNREVLADLQEGETISGGIYTDGQYIYFTKCTVTQSGEVPVEQRTICKVNIESKECAPIYSIPLGYAVWGVSGGSYILYSYNEDEAKEEYFRLSPSENAGKWQLSEHPVYQIDPSESGCFVLGGSVVEYFPKEALLKVTDLESGGSIEMDCSGEVPDYNPEWIPSISSAYAGSTNVRYLLLESPILEDDKGNHHSEYKLIDTVAGRFSKPITMKKNNGREILPFSEYGDYFCVITGFDSVNTSATSESGDYLASSYDIPYYALILKSDYFSQTENLISIENIF